MMYFLGITFFVSFVVSYYIRTNRKWWLAKKGITNDNKTKYTYKSVSQEHGGSVVSIAVEAPKNIYFIAKPERVWDRFCKELKLNVERQLGNEELDKSIYFITENDALVEMFRDSPEIQSSFLEIMNLIPSKGKLLDAIKTITSSNNRYSGKISCYGGIILLEFYTSDGRFDVEQLAEKVVPLLSKISTAMYERGNTIARNEGNFSSRAALILAITNAAAVCAAFWAFMPREIDYLRIIIENNAHHIIHSLAIGGLVTIAMVLLTFKFLRNTSRIHYVLIELVLVGAISFCCVGGFILEEINSAYDRSPTVFVDARVIKKHYTKKREGRYRYYLKVSHFQKIYNLEINNRLFSVVAENGEVCLLEKKGFLGYKWISDIKANRC